MTIKKSYDVGETVWIYGIDQRNARPYRGQIVKKFTINFEGFDNESYYIVAIPTEIEPLLEIRTWQTISQDETGPTGSFRETVQDLDVTKKLLSKVGLFMANDPESVNSSLADEDEEIDPDIIHAALEKSQQASVMPPINFKTEKPKRRYFKKKPKA